MTKRDRSRDTETKKERKTDTDRQRPRETDRQAETVTKTHRETWTDRKRQSLGQRESEADKEKETGMGGGGGRYYRERARLYKTEIPISSINLVQEIDNNKNPVHRTVHTPPYYVNKQTNKKRQLRRSKRPMKEKQ